MIGNWKANPATLARAEKIFVDFEKALAGRYSAVDLVVAAPLPFVKDLSELAGPQKIAFFAQDVAHVENGPHTGAVTASMLRSVDIKGSIVGHSERRAVGESDEQINFKIKSLLAANSFAVLCVGESERDGQGNYFSIVEEQIGRGLSGISASDMKKVVIAYEPVWAIGTGDNATPSMIEEMRLFINKVLTDQYDRATAQHVRVIYGGSVDPDNAEEILKEGDVDGFLVGGSSLEPKKFATIVKIADHYAKLA